MSPSMKHNARQGRKRQNMVKAQRHTSFWRLKRDCFARIRNVSDACRDSKDLNIISCVSLQQACVVRVTIATDLEESTEAI